MNESHSCNLERIQTIEYILYDFVPCDFKNRLICCDRSHDIGYVWGKVLIEKDIMELSGVMEKFCILICAAVTWTHIQVCKHSLSCTSKICAFYLHTKCVCELYIN